MTKQERISVNIIMICILLLVTPTAVKAIPPLPSSFHGTVKINAINVADGTLVQALIDDQVFAQDYTQTYNGDSVFTLSIPGDDNNTTAIDGGKDSDIIQFNVGGIMVDQTGTWHSGTNSKLDLSVTTSVIPNTPAPTPIPYPTQTPILIFQEVESSPTSGGSQTATEDGITSTQIKSTSIFASPISNGTQVNTTMSSETPPQTKSNYLSFLIPVLSIILIAGLGLGFVYLLKK